MSASRNPRTVVDLIPWDPESAEHVERLIDQRLACGWKSDWVETKWRTLQREGKMTLQWVVLRNEDSASEVRLAQHLATYPKESSPIVDSATSFGAKNRIPPAPVRSFIPIGHLSVDSEAEAFPGLADPSQGIYPITSFYISRALQSGGLGNAALDAIEVLAKGAPLYAKILTLDCIAKEYSFDKKMQELLQTPTPKHAPQIWYEKRGYEVYERIQQAYGNVHPALKTYHIEAVLMRKVLGD